MTVLRETVVQALGRLRFQADEQGLIDAFNVLVNQLPTAFWNEFAERLYAATPPEQRPEVERKLIHCAYECGYHTGRGILESPEFLATVRPMVTEGALDMLRGALAVFSAWGWAKSGVVKHVEQAMMVVRAVDYYEADGARDGRLKAYMLRGVLTAFFELVYAKPHPLGAGTFDCAQTQGIEVGDPYGEFIVTRQS